MEKETTGTGMKLTIQMIRTRFPSVPQMKTEELDRLMKNVEAGNTNRPLILLDVRGEQEFKVSHLPNAIPINPSMSDMASVLAQINSQVSNLEDKKTVVAYCSVGYRSSSLIQNLISELAKPKYNAYRQTINLYNLEGSIFKWANEKRAIVCHQNSIATYVHPYNAIWGKLLNHELQRYEPQSDRKLTKARNISKVFSQSESETGAEDTREPEEIQVSRLPNSIPVNPNLKDMSQLLSVINEAKGGAAEQATVIMSCAIGYRASIMTKRLMKELAKPENMETRSNIQVWNLEGAIFKWANEGKHMVDGKEGKKTKMVHGVNRLKEKLLFPDLVSK